MMLGNAAWGFRETPLDKQLEITRKMGLRLLELSIAGHPNDRLQVDASPWQIMQVKELFKKYDIKLGFLQPAMISPLRIPKNVLLNWKT